MADVYAYIKHADGVAEDSALELIVAAKKIAPDAPVTAVVTGTGADLDKVCNEMAATYNAVWKIDNAALAYPNAEVIRKALVNILPGDSVVLLPHDTFGMDLGPGLSIKMDSTFVADIVDIEGVDGGTLKVVRQEFSGMASAHVTCDISSGAVLNVRPGVNQPDESKTGGGAVEDKSGDAGDLSTKRTFLEVVEAEAGDVDITKSEVLVSVGRGIEDEDNVEMVFDLAKAMGADVSCSRPIVDAKWLEKSRQVGTSGQTVKPKVYLALGISGSFQHLGGIKGNAFIVAVNKNLKAPIFQVADVGVEADILEFIPELTEAIEGL
ncbi:MAG: electron transfer flavoprotein subunit alpha/FixB family protein [Desulfobacteraceae bacterium]|nr:electron transfer flavoprotein subunit alpha/FixB family protein [Desulfobacteraceae bacterium]MBC2757951.1 electron transfer flavoprotein subunit alpha/FixB family protein [Desulfobacteraceae bacterium]